MLRPGRCCVEVGGQTVTPLLYAMMEVDDSELTPEDHEFLKEWATALRVTVAVLVGRIL